MHGICKKSVGILQLCSLVALRNPIRMHRHRHRAALSLHAFSPNFIIKNVRQGLLPSLRFYSLDGRRVGGGAETLIRDVSVPPAK